MPKNSKGSFSDKTQIVTYVYQPETKPTTETSDSSTSGKPSAPTTSTDSSNQSITGKISDSNNNVSPAGSSTNLSHQTVTTKNTSTKLPKTGETIVSNYLIAGICTLFLATALLLFSRKKIK